MINMKIFAIILGIIGVVAFLMVGLLQLVEKDKKNRIREKSEYIKKLDEIN